jgi:D-3-phosphoglycerate dehydrogenase / 2-oxoglutarate reductase
MSEKPSYILDFDSNFVTVESLDELGFLATADKPDRELIREEMRALTTLGMTGEMPFDASLRARLKLFDANVEHIALLTEVLADRISPSALEHSDWFSENAQRLYVVSGGFEELIIPTVARLGILATNVYANRFVLDDDGNIVGHDLTRLTAQPGGKAAQVKALDLPRPIIAVGDGSTDLEIRLHGAADEFWAMTETIPRQSVVAQADRVLTSFLELA